MHLNFECQKTGYIHNMITDRIFEVAAPLEQDPLEIAAQLVMEDINIMMEGTVGDAQDYYL